MTSILIPVLRKIKNQEKTGRITSQKRKFAQRAMLAIRVFKLTGFLSNAIHLTLCAANIKDL